jgi:hypothetical protein
MLSMTRGHKLRCSRGCSDTPRGINWRTSEAGGGNLYIIERAEQILDLLTS